jgi:OHCU decarboxylase
MLSIGLHCRLVGRPGRAAALARFLDYVKGRDHVWVARRVDIARHWIKQHPPQTGYQPSRMSAPLFREVFGDIFEHTPKIAEATYKKGLNASHDTTGGLYAALVATMRAMTPAQKLDLIRAHPDLAGRLALAKQLTDDSTKEQGSAGLDRLSADELKRFTAINNTYRERFGFPFIMAVKGATKDQILAGFESRIGNSVETETAEALKQVERIALLRLNDRLPQ